MLFIFGGNNDSNNNAKPSSNDWPRRIVIAAPALQQIKSVLAPPTPLGPPLNVTGMFRGTWSSTEHNHTQGGSSLLQLEEAEVEGLPELTFVYGLLRTYRHSDSKPSVDLSFPVQGVLLSAGRRLFLFSTPYRSQRLMLQLLDRNRDTDTDTEQIGLRASPEGVHIITNTTVLSVLLGSSSSSAVNSSAFALGQHMLSARFRYMQAAEPRNLSQALSTTCSFLWEAVLPDSTAEEVRGEEKAAQLLGPLTAGAPCRRSLALSLRSYDLQYGLLARKVDVYSLVLFLLSLLQVALVVLQMRHSGTAALSGRMSVSSLLLQALLDAVICMAHLMLSGALPTIFFSSFIWICIVKLLLFSVFQMKLVLSAYMAAHAQQIAAEGSAGFRRRLIVLHLAFYAAVLGAVLLVFAFPAHPVLLVLLLYSYWWPQIVFSAVSGTRHPFHPLYLYGSSLSRLFLPLYLLGCPRNFLTLLWEYFSPGYLLHAHAPQAHLLSLPACYLLTCWLALQLLLLQLQSLYGPRFFVPKAMLPQRYDYHRPLPAALLLSDDDSDGIAMTSTSSATSSSAAAAYQPVATAEEVEEDVETGSRHSLECVICYNPVHGNLRHAFMVTPCDHVFHTACLSEWMAIKLECPVCRAPLPADEDQ